MHELSIAMSMVQMAAEEAARRGGVQVWAIHLVCPASYDLGESLRLVLLSVTEGEDKPLKYPTIFNTADVAVIIKMDIAAAVEFDLDAARANIQSVRPGMKVFEVSAKTGTGMDRFLKEVLSAED
jgi:hydrogenase nickel incorporation protein HypB